MGTLLWWIGNGVVVAVVLPAVAFLALRIIRALSIVQAAAADIRASLQTVATGIDPAMRSLSQVASRCESLAERVSERSGVPV